MIILLLKERVSAPLWKLGKLALILASAIFILLLGVNVVLAQAIHGTFSDNSDLCENCHSGLFGGEVKPETEQELCLNCHDQSIGSNPVLNSFGFDGQKWLKISRHKVPEGLMDCGDCHSPHIDTTVSPDLLAARGRKVSTGSQFCLVCHGQDQEGTGLALGGDHETGHLGVAAHDIKLNWSSSSKIKCANCHLPHGSVNSRLVGFQGKADKSFNEERLCYACHGSAGPSTLRGWTILDQFILPSHHPLVSNKARVECVSCHNPHFVQAAEGKTISDPDNTKNMIFDTTSFCLRCHDGAPPTAEITTNTVVPYTIKFSGDSGPFFPGWDQKSYVSAPAGHYVAGFTCLTCHHPHGSRNTRLVAFNYDNSPQAGEEKLCLACHRVGGAPGAADVATDMQKTYVHPVQAASGLHTDTEDFSNLSYFEAPLGSKRHAECTDCHNPHASQAALAVAPAASGKLSGVGGVNKDGQVVKTVKFEYELCFKCHSSYVILPPGQNDKRAEFNLANASYHPVEGIGKNPGIRPGAWVNSWSSGSMVYCSSCHGSESGRPGVHGSVYPHILRKPYKSEGRNGPDEICFSCHNYSTYVGESPSPDTRFAAHFKMTGKAGLSCRSCHVSHGVNRPHLITDVFIAGGVTRRLNYVHTETGGSCSPSPDNGCHQLKTYTNQY